MKLWKYFMRVAVINLLLYALIKVIEVNPIQVLVATLAQGFSHFVSGAESTVGGSFISIQSRFFIVELGLFQSFYEFLTVIALTIPLYWGSWKRLFTKLGILIGILLGYYTVLYGVTIALIASASDISWLMRFIHFNTESFMILVFILVWFLVNRREIARWNIRIASPS